jgi:hypothetical protein
MYYLEKDTELKKLCDEAEEIGHHAMAESVVDPFHEVYGNESAQNRALTQKGIAWLLKHRSKSYKPKAVEINIRHDHVIREGLANSRKRLGVADIDADFEEDDTPAISYKQDEKEAVIHGRLEEQNQTCVPHYPRSPTQDE